MAPDSGDAAPFDLAERAIGDVTILELAGSMTLDAGDRELEGTVSRLVSSGKTKLILDMTELLYIDSAGLGAIVRSYTAVSRSKGELILFHASKRLEDLFSITKLLTVMYNADSVEDLVPQFQREPLFIACPHCVDSVPVVVTRTYQECGRCGMKLKLSITDPVPDQIEVQMMIRLAYDDEPITVWPNFRPVRVKVGGRLNVMSLEVIRSLSDIAFRAGSPGLGVELTANRTEASWEALLRHCRSLGGCIIHAPGMSAARCKESSRGVRVLSDETEDHIRYRVAKGFLMLPLRRRA
jgi:anti-anti-sigma factor